MDRVSAAAPLLLGLLLLLQWASQPARAQTGASVGVTCGD